jgi:hypothetical protein
MKRRDFLRTIAASSAAAVAAPTLATAATASSRVGLLLPAHITFEQHFMRGWSGAGGPGAAQQERVATHAAAAATVSRWLERGSVDLIVSALSAHGPQTRALLESKGVPMLVADFGANWARASSALIVRQGLRMAEGVYALGRRAAQGGTRTGVIVTSAFDAGFDHVSAFRLGFEGHGGRVLDTLLLDSSAVAWDAQRLMALRSEAVFVAASDARSLAGLRVPLGTRVLASGLAPWLLNGVTLETALGFGGKQHPAFALGLEAARTIRRASELVRGGLHALPALLQARSNAPLQHLEMRAGTVVGARALEDMAMFEAGVQQLAASRSSGYTNAYPLL